MTAPRAASSPRWSIARSSGSSWPPLRTSVDGYNQVWKAVLDRFFARFECAAKVEVNDFGATPGTVTLRLEQAAEEVRS